MKCFIIKIYKFIVIHRKDYKIMQFVFYNTFSDRTEFEMSKGKRSWDILLIIKKGKIEFEFEESGSILTAEQNQIVYFPVNVSMTRKIVDPISFHQIGILVEDNALRKSLSAGVLNIPQKHIMSIIEGLDKASDLKNDDIYLHYAKHIVMENHVYSQIDADRKLSNMDDINFVMRYMREHMQEQINIEEVAKMVHLSHVGLIWKFNHCINMTPSSFLTHLRIQKAKQLLLETELKVNEISYLCGYTNPYYFSRRFKEFYHMSPSKYRDIMINKK